MPINVWLQGEHLMLTECQHTPAAATYAVIPAFLPTIAQAVKPTAAGNNTGRLRRKRR